MALCSDTSCVLAAPVAWDRFARTWEPCPRSLAALLGTPQSEKQHDKDSFRGILEAARPGENVNLLARHLREELGRVLKIPPGRIHAHKPFGAYGLDSLLSLEVARRLAQTLGLRVPVTALFNFPTIETLAAELGRRLGFEVNPREPVVPVAAGAFPSPGATVPLTEDEAILALIGEMEGAHE